MAFSRTVPVSDPVPLRRTKRLSLFVTTLLIAGIAPPVFAAPAKTLAPVRIGMETARFERGVPTVNLERPLGAVEIRPIAVDGKTISFMVAVYNTGSVPANFGTENVMVTIDGVPATILTKDQMADAAQRKAKRRTIGVVMLTGIVAGIASTASLDYGVVHGYAHTPYGSYSRTIAWEDDSAAVMGTAAAIGVGGAVVYGIHHRLDYTIDQLNGEALQTTTIAPQGSLGGTVVALRGKTPSASSPDVGITIRWNGEDYPFAFRVAPVGQHLAVDFPATPMPAPQVPADPAVNPMPVKAR